MPWYGFTQYGVQDIPDFESTVATGQIFLFPSNGALDEDGLLVVGGPPVGFLRCDGSAVNIIDHEDLYDYFVAAGVSFGAAPVGQFRLPNFQGRFPIGLNVADPNCNVIGETGGANTHTHTVADGAHTHTSAPHTHTINAHTHTYGNHTHSIPAHTHGNGTLTIPTTGVDNPYYIGSDISTAQVGHGHDVTGSSGNNGGTSGNPSTNVTGAISGGAPSSDGITDTAAGGPTASTSLGSSGGFDNIPPYQALHFVIKT